MMQWLFEKNCPIPTDNTKVMITAAANGSIELLKWLLIMAVQLMIQRS